VARCDATPAASGPICCESGPDLSSQRDAVAWHCDSQHHTSRHVDAIMSRPPHRLVYSIDAILGLSAGNAQRSSSSSSSSSSWLSSSSSSSSVGAAGCRRKCRDSNDDATDPLPNAAAALHRRSPGNNRRLLSGLPWERNFYPHIHPISIPMGSGVLGVYAGIRRIPTSGFFLTVYTHLSDHK